MRAREGRLLRVSMRAWVKDVKGCTKLCITCSGELSIDVKMDGVVGVRTPWWSVRLSVVAVHRVES